MAGEAYAEQFGKRAFSGGQFAEKVEKMVSELRDKYGLSGKSVEAAPEWGQMGLFQE